MKLTRAVFLWINTVLALVAGATLLLWPSLIKKWFALLGKTDIAYEPLLNDFHKELWAVAGGSGAIGAALIMVSLLFIWAAIRAALRKSDKEPLEFTDEQGSFRISPKAVEQSLARAAQALEEVQDLRVTVHKELTDGGPLLHIIAVGAAYEDNDLHQVHDKIRNTLKDRFDRMLRPEEEVRFDVELQRIIPKPKSKKESPKRDAASVEPEEGADFSITGPVYPVETENEGTH